MDTLSLRPCAWNHDAKEARVDSMRWIRLKRVGRFSMRWKGLVGLGAYESVPQTKRRGDATIEGHMQNVSYRVTVDISANIMNFTRGASM